MVNVLFKTNVKTSMRSAYLGMRQSNIRLFLLYNKFIFLIKKKVYRNQCSRVQLKISWVKSEKYCRDKGGNKCEEIENITLADKSAKSRMRSNNHFLQSME